MSYNSPGGTYVCLGGGEVMEVEKAGETSPDGYGELGELKRTSGLE